MTLSTKSLQDGFWEKFQIRDKDIEFLFNHLIEVEEPLSPQELISVLIASVIDEEKSRIEKQQQSNGAIYYPKEKYEIGQSIVFPALKWKAGIVRSIRKGFNPEAPSFDVIEVEFEESEKRQFASSLENHQLNDVSNISIDDPTLDLQNVFSKFGSVLSSKLNSALEKNKDLVRIAGKWFPLTLLVDVNIGYMNLAEALLDMENGGPLSTSAILEQIDLPTDVNQKLTLFSLNLALQQDDRFDEVGPSGEMQWFLHRLEPASVNKIPVHLKYNGNEIDYSPINDMLKQFDKHAIDELETLPYPQSLDENEEIPISLIYPHWRSGTLPINQALFNIFPTALESPRILFKFFDLETKNTFNGWVVRESNYVYGLEEWYHTVGLIPGNIVYISKSNNSGEVNIRVDKRRLGREWIRTATINPAGNVSFTMLKQMVSASFDERMSFFIPDVKGIDLVWEGNIKNRVSVEKAVLGSMLELAKLNPQGQVHAQELYAANNIIKRCPPSLILSTLIQSRMVIYLGDLYFRMDESAIEANRQ
jgi:hypothetical protein